MSIKRGMELRSQRPVPEVFPRLFRRSEREKPLAAKVRNCGLRIKQFQIY